MPFDTVLSLAKKHYGDYPGPTKYTYGQALGVSEYLLEQEIDTTGVIAFARDVHGSDYIALSKDLQLAAGNHFRGGRRNYYFCTTVAEDLWNKYHSPCAEKKIITKIRGQETELAEITVVAHPDNVWASNLPAYIVSGNKDGVCIGPCSTCLEAYGKR